MTSHPRPTPASTRAERAREHLRHERIHLARHHAELLLSVRRLRHLASRAEQSDMGAQSRHLAAAIIDQVDALLPDVLAGESRVLSPSVEEADDPWTRQAGDQLRADHGWMSTNWYELRPLLDGVARQQSWVDAVHLRDAADLFCTLLWEHVSLATTLLERAEQHSERAPSAAPH